MTWKSTCSRVRHEAMEHTLTAYDLSQLLILSVDIMEELRRRGIVRTENTPAGDLAEYLFCRAFDWTQEPNSKKGFDATGKDGTRYQIKGRRINDRNPSRQVSAIRSFDEFDFLAVVLFNHFYQVKRAALIPVAIVQELATREKRTNSYRLMMYDRVWDIPEVQDMTRQLWESFADSDLVL